MALPRALVLRCHCPTIPAPTPALPTHPAPGCCSPWAPSHLFGQAHPAHMGPMLGFMETLPAHLLHPASLVVQGR